jgi:hypothetical protein
MLISFRFLVIAYIIICLIFVLIFFKFDNKTQIVVGERDYMIKKFFTSILLCLAITPIIYFLIKGFKKNT